MDFMPVGINDSKYVHRAFRLVNMALSENIYKKWFKHVESNLQCSQLERKNYDNNNSELNSNVSVKVQKRLEQELLDLKKKDKTHGDDELHIKKKKELE